MIPDCGGRGATRPTTPHRYAPTGRARIPAALVLRLPSKACAISAATTKRSARQGFPKPLSTSTYSLLSYPLPIHIALAQSLFSQFAAQRRPRCHPNICQEYLQLATKRGNPPRADCLRNRRFRALAEVGRRLWHVEIDPQQTTPGNAPTKRAARKGLHHHSSTSTLNFNSLPERKQHPGAEGVWVAAA